MIGNDVLDAGLSFLVASANRIDLCSREPASFADATGALSLGYATDVSVSTPEDVPGGRRVMVRPVRGRVLAKGRPYFWALTGAGKLLATGPAEFSGELAPGVDFELPAAIAGLMR